MAALWSPHLRTCASRKFELFWGTPHDCSATTGGLGHGAVRFDSAAGGALVGDFTALRLSLSACFGAGASGSSANSCRVPSLLSVTFCCPERGASTTNATTRTLIPAVGCMVALLTTPLSHATLTTRAKKYTRACGRRAPHRVVRRTTARRTPRRGV